MKNIIYSVHAENIGGTFDKEYETKKKLSKIHIEDKTHVESSARDAKRDKEKIKGVHAENVGGTGLNED